MQVKNVLESSKSVMGITYNVRGLTTAGFKSAYLFPSAFLSNLRLHFYSVIPAGERPVLDDGVNDLSYFLGSTK